MTIFAKYPLADNLLINFKRKQLWQPIILVIQIPTGQAEQVTLQEVVVVIILQKVNNTPY
ncbi:hypothetical protein NEISICOT_01001 [Neisseria sicca ATCC 29256]|uniref:Uncharacterized protein n=1 Tax=Neisseria sicca ATCC 29256 TaxID=547045 RepID=C6M3B0_NEISI|nr:hypothetical protein NEISICOT_01001 [Neisseria sicca ATCC 29256]